jgi:DNA recombination protein RmuC
MMTTMTNSVFLLVILTLVSALAGAAVVLWWRSTQQAPDPVDLAPLVEAFRAEQAQAHHAVVESVLSLAADKLGVVGEAVAKHVDERDRSMEQQMVLRSGTVESQVSEMRDSMAKVADLVVQLQSDRAAQHREMLTRLEATSLAQESLTRVTTGLRDALASPKSRGSWGERTAADLLRHSGMVEGVSFVRQRRLDAGTQPDFTFLLPQDRQLHMDVKFPADNYLRSLEANSEVDRQRFTKQFLVDVRQRIKELSGRSYIDPTTTVDYLLLFIPNESVHAFICEHDPDLIDVALRQKVILCSPFTLFSVLAVVRQSVEVFQLERRTDDILAVLGDFSRQWDKFSESIDKVEKHLATLQNSVGEMSGTRRRVLQRQLDRVAELSTVVDHPQTVTVPVSLDSSPSELARVRALPQRPASTG